LAFRQPGLAPDEAAHLQRWRRRVVVSWIATMAVAVVVWGAVSVFALAPVFEFLAASLLAVLALLAARLTYAGACPRCGGRIRFQPRVELPASCPHCGVALTLAGPSDSDR